VSTFRENATSLFLSASINHLERATATECKTFLPKNWRHAHW